MLGALEAGAKDVTAWTCYSIGRDNLGSITDIISDQGMYIKLKVFSGFL